MNNLNYVLLQGRVTRDPDISEPVAGVPLCRFTIAVNRYFVTKGSDKFTNEVNYFRITAWYKLAENCAKYITKGREIRVVGRLRQDRWEDEKTVHEKVHILAQHIEFAGNRKNSDSDFREVSEEKVLEETTSTDDEIATVDVPVEKVICEDECDNIISDTECEKQCDEYTENEPF